MNSSLSIIIGREYMERVKRKSFIITTLLAPLLMALIGAVPTLVMVMAGAQNTNIAVMDQTGIVASHLTDGEELKYIATDEPFEQVMENEDYEAILVLERDFVDNTKHAKLYTRDALSMVTQSEISNQLEKIVEDIRLKNYDIDNLQQILDEVQADVSLSTDRMNADEDEAEETSSLVSYAIGMVMDMVMYMFILIYGQMVMTSIIEEKNNRVLEIIVSSVDPKWLMAGKIIGIGLVAVTQIVIWAVLMFAFSLWVMPMLSGMIETSGAAESAEVVQAMGQIGNPLYILSIFGYATLFLIGGYLFYSSIYAAIGSSVDNIQDASQIQTLAVMPIIIALICAMTVSASPTGTFATIVSLVPFTSPMVMMTRIPYGVPTWEIWTSLAILALSVVFMIWLCGKIYRVGIFMYGKKPTFADLIRWARYK